MPDFIGFDVGSHTVKAVQLARKSGKPYLYSFHRAPSIKAPLISESGEETKQWVKYLKDFFAEGRFSTRDVVVGLPESQVFTRVIQVPKMSTAELRTAIKWEAEQYIPVPLKEVSMDYQVLSEEGGGNRNKMEILLVAAPVKLVKGHLNLFEKAGLNVVGVETEALAVSRAVVGESADTLTTMVVNIGAATTDIAIVSRGTVRFTRSISTGGVALARSVSQALGFEMDQAEQYKVTYGLDETQLEGKIMESIKPIIDMLVSDMRRSLSFYANRYPNDPVKQASLCGGTALLPGMLAYLVSALDIEVQLADPWRAVDLTFEGKKTVVKKEDIPLLRTLGPGLAVAVGLSLKEF